MYTQKCLTKDALHPMIYSFLPTELLLEKYPSVNIFGWNSTRVSIFYHSHLLVGNYGNGKSKMLINERSFLALMGFAKKMAIRKAVYLENPTARENDLLSPAELIQEYPNAAYMGWCPTKVGIFLSAGLLVGHNRGVGQSSLITRKSFILLVDHAHGTFEKWIEVTKFD